jgi:phosphoribosylaminoimidazole-succinocarboxamide synthase
LPTPLFESDLPSLTLVGRGKVRDLYAVDASHLLLVSTDRLSAFDVILPDPIPFKGHVLTAMSKFWFAKLSHIVPSHVTDVDPESVVKTDAEREQVRGRSMVVRRLHPLPIEAVVRGFLIGSGWKDYQSSGAVCGIRLPAGLRQADKLPAPIFTPATKAEAGSHDENISLAEVEAKIGAALASQVKDASLAIYAEAAAYAAERGILVADTKFEFGTDAGGHLVWIDEALTADSSRFWPADQYRPGASPPSFDKQFVRDYLETLDWNKQAPGPKLPADILRRTSDKYREALSRLTGIDLKD